MIGSKQFLDQELLLLKLQTSVKNGKCQKFAQEIFVVREQNP